MVTASTGVITTIVGSSSIGHSGDGGDATSASLRLPNGVTVDAEGNTSLNRFHFCFTSLLSIQATCMSRILGTIASARLQYPLYLRTLQQNPLDNHHLNQLDNPHRNQVDNPLDSQLDSLAVSHRLFQASNLRQNHHQSLHLNPH